MVRKELLLAIFRIFCKTVASCPPHSIQLKFDKFLRYLSKYVLEGTNFGLILLIDVILMALNVPNLLPEAGDEILETVFCYL